MALVRIKQLYERVATQGLFMGGSMQLRRKLEPGEIVDVPVDMLEGHDNLFDMLWNTGVVDLVPETEAPTRPLDYRDYREAKLCSPSFKPLSATDEREMAQARERVRNRMIQQSAPLEADSPADKPAPTKPKRAARKKTLAKKPAGNRRAARRANREASEHGETHIT